MERWRRREAWPRCRCRPPPGRTVAAPREESAVAAAAHACHPPGRCTPRRTGPGWTSAGIGIWRIRSRAVVARRSSAAACTRRPPSGAGSTRRRRRGRGYRASSNPRCTARRRRRAPRCCATRRGWPWSGRTAVGNGRCRRREGRGWSARARASRARTGCARRALREGRAGRPRRSPTAELDGGRLVRRASRFGAVRLTSVWISGLVGEGARGWRVGVRDPEARRTTNSVSVSSSSSAMESPSRSAGGAVRSPGAVRRGKPEFREAVTVNAPSRVSGEQSGIAPDSSQPADQ